MFFKKKDKTTIKMTHYEGLENMPHHANCWISLEGNNLKFVQIPGDNTAQLPISNINSSDYMSNVDFMAKYKNTTIERPTKLIDIVMFWVIEFISTQDNCLKRICFYVMLPNDKGVETFARNIRNQIPSKHLNL